MFPVLNDGQLKRLSEHKYSAQCSTILDPYFQVYWRWLVQQLPMWLAPNLITCLGLLINVLTSMVLIWFCPQARGEVPPWALLLASVGLFVYQSLDAVDGKQARRTGSASPLGELMDHGCDAVSMVVVAVAVSITWQLGMEPQWMCFICLTSITLFYCAHWQAYVSGTIKFGKIDVTELQVMVMLIFFTTSVCGSSVWAMQVPYLHMSLRKLSLWGCVLGTFYTLSTISIGLYQGGQGKNGSTVAGTSVISPAFPIAFMLYLAYQVAKPELLQRHPCLFALTFGLACSKLTIKLVVACMTKSPLEKKDSVMIPGLIQVFNIHFGSHIDEVLLLFGMMTWVLVDLFRYCTALTNEICSYLNITCFTITPQVSPNEKTR